MTNTIVIGAGPNGLAAAILCAKKGHKVTVLEAGARPGGLARLAPGPVRVNRATVARLGLGRHGLELADAPPPVFLPEVEGPGLLLEQGEITARSARDGERYGKWRAWIQQLGPFLRGVLDSQPPDPLSGAAGDLVALGKTALGLRRLGGDEMLELLRVVPMCAADWLGEWFEDPLLQAGLASRALRAGVNGPWAPHTAGLLLLGECAGDASVAHGDALADALVQAAEAAKVTLRMNTPVESIRAAGGRVEGVTLWDGESVDADLVLSAADPKRTLLELLGARHLEPRVVHELEGYRMRGTTAFVRLTLDTPLSWRSRPGESFAHAALTGDLDDLERAFDPIKYGEWAERPWLDVHTRGNVVAIEAHCAPHVLKDGWSDERRAAFGEVVLAQLRRYAEVSADSISAREVLTPADVERVHRVTGGHVLHGEPALDQLLFLRPAAALSRYATPVAGLFLCSPGTHPGGLLTLGSAALAARAAGVS
jgi:phytoene dehydrogenase-like protein